MCRSVVFTSGSEVITSRSVVLRGFLIWRHRAKDICEDAELWQPKPVQNTVCFGKAQTVQTKTPEIVCIEFKNANCADKNA